MLGDCASGRRIGAVGVNILAINILSSGGESAAMLATSIALFETVKLELCLELINQTHCIDNFVITKEQKEVYFCLFDRESSSFVNFLYASWTIVPTCGAKSCL